MKNITKNALIATLGMSALGLGAFLMQPQTEQVEADMLSSLGSTQLMTSKISDNEEALFVLDGNEEVLLIYRADNSRENIEKLEAYSVADLLGVAQEEEDDDRGRRRNSRR